MLRVSWSMLLLYSLIGTGCAVLIYAAIAALTQSFSTTSAVLVGIGSFVVALCFNVVFARFGKHSPF